jgi:hydrogenase maturation protease
VTSRQPIPRVRLILLGAVDRGDDAVGPLAVAMLPKTLWPLVQIRVRRSLDIVDLADVPSDGACLVVDAARGLSPGTVRFIPFARFLRPRATPLPEPRSSHELPVPTLIRLTEVMRGRLPRGGFLVAGGSAFGLGELPSREVALAIPRLVEAIESAVYALSRPTHARPRHLETKATPCASR